MRKVGLVAAAIAGVLVIGAVGVLAFSHETRADLTSSFGIYEGKRAGYWQAELKSPQRDRRISALRALAWLGPPAGHRDIFAATPGGAIDMEELVYRAVALARTTDPSDERHMLALRVIAEEGVNAEQTIANIALLCLGDDAIPTLREMREKSVRGAPPSRAVTQLADDVINNAPSVAEQRKLCDRWRSKPIFREPA
ncbi:MAG: hypothetical protein JNJ73_18185 [Hyphomonadaceae bacterium]|nr:hypothetical protein [Hyphomonadaceae bacterium]